MPPDVITVASAYSTLRDQTQHRVLEALTGSEGSQALHELLASERGPISIRIALREAAPEFEFLNLAGWEWLHHHGSPLRAQAMVERFATVNWNNAPRVSGDIAVLDTWFDQPGRPQRQFNLDTDHTYCYRGLKNIRTFLASGAFAAFSAGVVVAHGNPAWHQGTQGQFLAQGESTPDWQFGDAPLPPVVLLLVCGDDQAGFVSGLARQLLTQGARCVIAPNGTLSRAEADTFLTSFIQGWTRGATVAELLHTAQSQASVPGGPQSLWLVGDGSISREGTTRDVGESPRQRYEACRQTLKRLSNSAGAGATLPLDQDSFAELLRSIGLASLQSTGSFDAAADQVLGLIAKLWRDAVPVRVLAGALDGAAHGTGSVHRTWLSRVICFLEEAYGQGMLKRHVLQAQLAELDVPQPRLRLCQARGLYRLGAYDKCTPAVLRALDESSNAPQLRSLRLDLLGELAAYFVDLNLGPQAKQLCDAIRAELDPTDSGEAFQLFALRDRLARALVRCGDIASAIHEQQLKRSETHGWQLDGQRELAWQLFLAAWSPQDRPAAATAWANEVRMAIEARLVGENPDRLRFSSHDDPLPYLVRAACTWDWRVRDGCFSNLVEPIIQMLETNVVLAPVDPGPIGFASASLYLGGHPTAETVWRRARDHMTERRYHLELAVLERLLGDLSGANCSLLRFHKLRAQAVRLPTGCAWPTELGGSAIDAAHLSAQDAREASALVDGSAEQLSGVGLLPM